ncbi:hypothetical protein WJX84_004839 [Apatococcus fuscideae]|uniref:Uncharacterized protein n=1 Tax=Apatococcus fuscideae TaxID=2026836 RepID=A0AAW1T545_9CHLO
MAAAEPCFSSSPRVPPPTSHGAPVTSHGTEIEAAGLLGAERQALALQRKAFEEHNKESGEVWFPTNPRWSYGKSKGGLHTTKVSLPEPVANNQHEQTEGTELQLPHDVIMQQARRSVFHAGSGKDPLRHSRSGTQAVTSRLGRLAPQAYSEEASPHEDSLEDAPIIFIPETIPAGFPASNNATPEHLEEHANVGESEGADEVSSVWRDDRDAADVDHEDATQLSQELRLMEEHYEAELHTQRREKAELRLQVEGLQMAAFTSQTQMSALQKKHATHLKAARAELMIKHEVEMAQIRDKLDAQAQAELKKAVVTDKDKRIADLVQELEIEKVVRRYIAKDEKQKQDARIAEMQAEACNWPQAVKLRLTALGMPPLSRVGAAETGTPMDELAKELRRKAFRADKLLPGASITIAEGSEPGIPLPPGARRRRATIQVPPANTDSEHVDLSPGVSRMPTLRSAISRGPTLGSFPADLSNALSPQAISFGLLDGPSQDMLRSMARRMSAPSALGPQPSLPTEAPRAAVRKASLAEPVIDAQMASTIALQYLASQASSTAAVDLPGPVQTASVGEEARGATLQLQPALRPQSRGDEVWKERYEAEHAKAEVACRRLKESQESRWEDKKQYAHSLAALEFRIGNLEACHAHRDAELDRRMHATVHWAIRIISSMPGSAIEKHPQAVYKQQWSRAPSEALPADGQETHRAKLGMCSVLIQQLAAQEATFSAQGQKAQSTTKAIPKSRPMTSLERPRQDANGAAPKSGHTGGKAVSASRRTLALAEEILRLRAIAVDLQGQLIEQTFTSNQLQLQLSEAEQQGKWQAQQGAGMEHALALARSDLLFAQERIKTMGGSMVFRSVHQADTAQIAYLRDELKRAQRSAAWQANAHQALMAGREARVQALENRVQALLQEMKAYRIGFANLQQSTTSEASPSAPASASLE